MDSSKRHLVAISYCVCRTCKWTMQTTEGGFFQCINRNCDDLLRPFQVFTTMAEVPMEQVKDGIPGVSNG